MTWHQGPSQGPSATASTTRGQAARMASAATTRGAACPRRVSVAKTRQDLIKMFLWAQQDKHGSPGRDVWTRSTGLGLAAAGGHESAAIRRAWVRGGHWVRGGPAGVISRERQAWGAATRDGGTENQRRAWDSHSRISPAIGGHEGPLAARDKTQEQNQN